MRAASSARSRALPQPRSPPRRPRTRLTWRSLAPALPSVSKWDAITAIALLITALFTPFEIAFLGAAQRWWDGVFILNRIVDVIFTADIGVQFFLMQCVSDKCAPPHRERHPSADSPPLPPRAPAHTRAPQTRAPAPCAARLQTATGGSRITGSW